MTKTDCLRFAESAAHRDFREGTVSSRADFLQGLHGYAACLSRFGEGTATIHRESAEAAVAAYQTCRGALALPAISASGRKRHLVAAVPDAIRWAGSLLRLRASRRRVA